MNRFRRTKNGLELIPWEETEEYKVHQRVMAQFDAMTDEEKFKTFVDTGIYTKEGELTQRYGGTAPNKIVEDAMRRQEQSGHRIMRRRESMDETHLEPHESVPDTESIHLSSR